MAAPSDPPQKPGAAGRRRRSVVARVTEAAIAFREGEPVAIRGPDGIALAYALEMVTAHSLGDVKGGVLLLTHARARTLKIRIYTPEVVALPLDNKASPETLRAIADPTLDLAEPMKGPFEAVRDSLPTSFAASVKLAKLSGLLPATIAKSISDAPSDTIEISVADVHAFEMQSLETLALVTRARVPLEGAENTELVAFRSRDGGPEHYAIVIGAPLPHQPVLTRLHSECFTGDLLGSLKCDCGPQLAAALAQIAASGWGILLYLRQEGRSIGLVNKLRAYQLQDQGFDTVDANHRLGFQDDERDFAVAARMLALLSRGAIRLLTNNPRKVAALEAEGVEVVERVPLKAGAGAHNEAYLATKRDRSGHQL